VTFYELDGPELEHYDDGDNSEVRDMLRNFYTSIVWFNMIRITSLLKDRNYME
jgi:hypothetical protein